MAFGLCFFFLFNREDSEKNELFADLSSAFLKTIIMVFAGELDYGGLDFNTEYDKFIFTLFVFFIILGMIFNFIFVLKSALIFFHSDDEYDEWSGDHGHRRGE